MLHEGNGSIVGKGFGHRDAGFAAYAGWAFAKTGKRRLGIEILKRLLVQCDVVDSAYRMLNNIAGQSALPFYEQLHIMDPLEPRVLIWKASLLIRGGRFMEAEATAKQAVVLDPTGEVDGVRTSTLAFALLADLYDMEHKQAEAITCRNRIEAARLAKRAMDFDGCGLFPQAIALFNRSLQKFPADFAVEMRFAETLEHCGRLRESNRHFLRAIELSPDGVGPATSVDFRQAENLPFARSARTLGLLVRRARTSASAALVLGILERSTRGDRRVTHTLRHAVRLDARFLDAWSSLAYFGRLTDAERVKATDALIELGSSDAGFSWLNLSRISDIRPIYRHIQMQLQRRPAVSTGPLFPLHSGGLDHEWLPDSYTLKRSAGGNETVGSLIAGDNDIQAITELCEQWGTDESSTSPVFIWR